MPIRAPKPTPLRTRSARCVPAQVNTFGSVFLGALMIEPPVPGPLLSPRRRAGHGGRRRQIASPRLAKVSTASRGKASCILRPPNDGHSEVAEGR